MNERIRELAKQAGFYPENNWDHTNWHAAGHNPTFEKFAELIVLECASIVDTYGRWILYDKLAVKIKREFGVEE